MAQKKDPTDASLDPGGISARYQQRLRNLDSAMRAAIDGMHAIAVRQCEAASAMTRLSADLLARPNTPGGIDGYARAGQEFGRRAVEAALAHALALTEIAAKMQQDSVTALGQASWECLGDLCAMLQNGAERR